MRNHQLESRVRENRTHGSEGGEGDSPFLPLSVVHRWLCIPYGQIPAYAGMTPRRKSSWGTGLSMRYILTDY